MTDKYKVEAVGYIRSDIKSRLEAPRQGRDAAVEAVVEVLPGFYKALKGIERFSSLQIVCWLHKARRDQLRVHPKGNPSSALSGVFATRSPMRPNPLAVYTVDLLEVKEGFLKVKGVDAVDGTPVLDIKPYVHRLDD